MKKSEINFKCVLGSEARNKQMYDALTKAGLRNLLTNDSEFINTAMCLWVDDRWLGEVAPRYSHIISENYENNPSPEITFHKALEVLASIEPDAPEFDIKPFDKVLWKQRPKIKSYNDTTWHVDFYAGRINVDSFACIGNTSADCLLLYNADTLELNNSFDYPAGWWECENGKTVWRTK